MNRLQLADVARVKQILALQQLVMENSKDVDAFLELSCQAVAHYLAMPAAAIVKPSREKWHVLGFHGSSGSRATLAEILQRAFTGITRQGIPANRLFETPQRGPLRLLVVPFCRESLLVILNSDPRELTSDELWAADCLGVLLGSAFSHLHQEAKLASSGQEALAAIVAMAHDLRSPLNVILGYTHLLSEEAYGPLSEKQRKVLGSLEAQAQTLLSLLSGALDLARLETVGASEAQSTISLSDLISELTSAARSRTLSEDLTIEWSVAQDIPPLAIEKGHLQHILQNLIDNALRAAPRGKISVTAAYDAPRERVRLTVADTGKGLNPADIPRLFELFRNGGGKVERPATHGCGLYLVRKFCEKLGAKISVESQPGQGAAFTVLIPLKGKGASPS